jgi:hypothetical protein
MQAEIQLLWSVKACARQHQITILNQEMRQELHIYSFQEKINTNKEPYTTLDTAGPE